jgi:nitroimidazol reductase NimA-like FMN-containing flavoprotein (pyridoxamine 5'-phosphate oxidase superfamily)
MKIHQMTREESVALLTRARIGRLACAHDGQPYITPISCAFSDNRLYSFSRSGQKLDWMRENPLVCVEFEELVSAQDWATVIVLGKYEELTGASQNAAGRELAFELLQKRPVWWEPGCLTTTPQAVDRQADIAYFRVHIGQISGHRGVPDRDEQSIAGNAGSSYWLQKILKRN